LAGLYKVADWLFSSSELVRPKASISADEAAASSSAVVAAATLVAETAGGSSGILDPAVRSDMDLASSFEMTGLAACKARLRSWVP
jgi:hypothetical protein